MGGQVAVARFQLATGAHDERPLCLVRRNLCRRPGFTVMANYAARKHPVYRIRKNQGWLSQKPFDKTPEPSGLSGYQSMPLPRRSRGGPVRLPTGKMSRMRSKIGNALVSLDTNVAKTIEQQRFDFDDLHRSCPDSRNAVRGEHILVRIDADTRCCRRADRPVVV